MFFITLFTNGRINEEGYQEVDGSITVGFVEDLNEAVRILNGSSGDLHLGNQIYAVVEELHPGMLPKPKSKYFFRYDEEKKGYHEFDVPEEFKEIVCYALY